MCSRKSEAREQPLLEEEIKKEVPLEDTFNRKIEEAGFSDIQQEIDRKIKEDERKKRIEKSGLSLVEFENIDEELAGHQGAKERRTGAKSDYYRQYYEKIFHPQNEYFRLYDEISAEGNNREKQEEGLEKISEGIFEDIAQLSVLEGELKKGSRAKKSEIRQQFEEAKEALAAKRAAFNALQSDFQVGELGNGGRSQELDVIEAELAKSAQENLTEELKVKIGAYNALRKDLPLLKFDEKEREIIDKPWKSAKVSLEYLAKMEAQERKKEEEIEKRERQDKVEAKVSKMKEQEQKDREKAAKIKAIIHADKPIGEPEMKKAMPGFEPADYVQKRGRLFEAQEKLTALGFVPGAGLKNGLGILFRSPSRFGEYRRLKKEYDVLNQEVSRQYEIAEKYLTAKEAEGAFFKEEGKIMPKEKVARLEQKSAIKADLLPLRKSIEGLDKHLKLLKQNPDFDELLDFTAEDYFGDYVYFVRLQDELMEKFGFSPMRGNWANRREAKKHGNAESYGFLKEAYDRALADLQEIDKRMAPFLGKKGRIEKGGAPQSELFDEIRKAMRTTLVSKKERS